MLENGDIYIMTKSYSFVASCSNVIYRFIKRLFDIIFSAILLILSSPICVIAIIGIKLSSSGPVFYVAQRLGKDGKVFKMYKFRSMHVDMNTDEKSLRPDRDRVFGFGRFIRSTKIDEIPQVMNVFWGQMSVVGPRPAAKDQIEITRSGKNHATYGVKAGLTSPSAIYDYIFGDEIADESEYNTKVLPTRLALDLLYLEKRSLWYDLKIIIYTAICILCNLVHIKPNSIYIELTVAAKEILLHCDKTVKMA